MSDAIQPFGTNFAALGYDLEARLDAWDALRAKMVRTLPETFTRDEWAYLIGFVAKPHLTAILERTFKSERPHGGACSLFRARGPLAIWLPSNISLLGPLVMVLASFTGMPIRIKAGSKSPDLCAPFIAYLLEYISTEELRGYLQNQVKIERFDRQDPRNAEMAAEASVRIAFGSDAAVAAIHALPHPPNSIGIHFGDHRSEAWLDAAAVDDASLLTLIKVFMIYGQAGCTSPRRILLLGGSNQDAETLCNRMSGLWSQAVKRDIPMHVASSNILYSQINKVQGWKIHMQERHGAIIGVGALDLPELAGPMSIAIIPARLEQAIASLPANIQTIGYQLKDAHALLPAIARTNIKRFVPIAQMHHFGPVWDGQNFFRLLFEEVDLQ